MEKKYDKYLFGAVILLTIIGTVMIYSASTFRYSDSMHFLKKQIFNLIIGSILLYLGWKIEYHFWQRYALVSIIVAGLISLIPVIRAEYLGVGTIKGANRFVPISGFSFQPSEIARFLAVVFLAEELARRRPVIQSLRYGLLPVVIPTAILVMIIIKQRSFGMALGFSAVTITMLLLANTKLLHLAAFGTTAFVLIGILLIKTPYAYARIKSFLFETNLQGGDYQAFQSLIALGRGGITGVGLGEGMQKMYYLPEAQTDFIFAIIGEELGFWGTTLVLLLFGLIAWRGLKIALNAPDAFGRNMAIGITSMIFIFAMINLSVVTRIIPTTGIPLPFISYGGTQLITNLFMVGVLLNISSSIKNQENNGLHYVKVKNEISVGRRRNRRTYNPSN